MKNYPYTTKVTITEECFVTELELDRERVFRRGQNDRINGLPCASDNGCYLNGWYNPTLAGYYVHADAQHLV